MAPEQRRLAVLEALDDLEFRHPNTICDRSGLDRRHVLPTLQAMSIEGLAEWEHLVAQHGWYEYRRTPAGTEKLQRLKEATRGA